MPSRQISPQSFDDILSELGDDPAIPDPHGIRKPNNPKKTPWDEGLKPQNQSQRYPSFAISDHIPALAQFKNLGIFLVFVLLITGAGATLLMAHDSMKSTQEAQALHAQEQIAELKKEIGLLRDEMIDIEDAINESIDSIEVSVHLLDKNKSASNPKPKAPPIPFEAELLRWRYLGLSQIGVSRRAFFHNGKTTVMQEVGSSLLGDWVLSMAEKGSATLTHPKGKSVTLTTSQTE